MTVSIMLRASFARINHGFTPLIDRIDHFEEQAGHGRVSWTVDHPAELTS
ncbi:hypothetical protein [Burkholderia sp. Bp8963]|nr:hypothetical protein [Burkholderia sp. Bp8963]